ncbi:MAG: hypothetical protein WCL32_21520 [Planctomycetota bacterium]
MEPAPQAVASPAVRRWRGELRLRQFGFEVGIRSNRRAAIREAARQLPYGWTVAADERTRPSGSLVYSLWIHGDDSASLFRGKRPIVRRQTLGNALIVLGRDMEIAAAVRNRQYIVVHAGVVGWRGRAIAIPGRSFTGKSSLTAALCEAGATYYSDEYALFDAAGLIHPFPRPIHLRLPAAARFHAPIHNPVTVLEPLPLGVACISRYREGKVWQPRPLSPGQAALDFLGNSFAARHHPEKILPVLQRALAGALIWRSVRGEADMAARAILAAADQVYDAVRPINR